MNSKVFLLVATVSLTFLCVAFRVEAGEIGPTQTNDATSFNNARKLVRGTDGVLHAVWQNYNNISCTDKQILYARSTDRGQTWVDLTFFSNARNPTIALDTQNNPHIVIVARWKCSPSTDVLRHWWRTIGWQV